MKYNENENKLYISIGKKIEECILNNKVQGFYYYATDNIRNNEVGICIKMESSDNYNLLTKPTGYTFSIAKNIFTEEEKAYIEDESNDVLFNLGDKPH